MICFYTKSIIIQVSAKSRVILNLEAKNSLKASGEPQLVLDGAYSFGKHCQVFFAKRSTPSQSQTSSQKTQQTSPQPRTKKQDQKILLTNGPGPLLNFDETVNDNNDVLVNRFSKGFPEIRKHADAYEAEIAKLIANQDIDTETVLVEYRDI